MALTFDAICFLLSVLNFQPVFVIVFMSHKLFIESPWTLFFGGLRSIMVNCVCAGADDGIFLESCNKKNEKRLKPEYFSISESPNAIIGTSELYCEGQWMDLEALNMWNDRSD